MSAAGPLTIHEAVACLRAGKVIAYPTEAVYGLGCDPHNEDAVHSILRMKGRPASAGLILLADDFDRLRPFIGAVSEEWLQRALSSWPGPVTWLFPRGDKVPDWLAGTHSTVAIRLTAHPVCRELCRVFGGAIVSTSANRAGKEPARDAAAVRAAFSEGLCGVVRGDLGGEAGPSEIRDLATGRIVRPGGAG